MIIIYDSGGRNIFSDIIKENGQNCSNHFRYLVPGRFGRYFGSKGLLRRLPDTDDSDPLIIVFDSGTTPSYVRRIKMRFLRKKVIYWCWNRIDEKEASKVEQIQRLVPVWSYSPDDCKRYGLKYNTQFFFDSFIPDDLTARQIRYDPNARHKALFIGRQKKEREEILSWCFSELKKCGVEIETYISKPGKKILGRRVIREKLIPYKDIIEKTKHSDIVIDCYGSERAGCSLRVMEAMFFGKKLITDNHSLAEYDFYDSHNIYIIGKENKSLNDFLAEPYVPVPHEIRDRYRFSNWIDRFMEIN